MDSCAARSRAQAEPLIGTAATATTWLLIEQPGPWGPKALTDSRLDPALGRHLAAAAAGTGVRVALIRRPGRHAAPGTGGGPRRVLAAHTSPGNAWVRATHLADPWALLGLDLARLGTGEHDGRWEPRHGPPLALVCVHGRRDPCCARDGRPLAAGLAAGGGAEVWETTHIGGHRFAPTLLTLPHGYAYGRMTAVAAQDVLTSLREGRMVLGHCRGRSRWDRPGQAAELAVRALTGERNADALGTRTTEPHTGGGWAVTVSHADGRRWRVTVAEDMSAPPLPASCGAAPAPQPRMTVTDVTPAHPSQAP